MSLQRGGVVLGLRFKPGAATGWLDLPITEIVGREIDKQDIWGAKARHIAESVREMEGTGTQLDDGGEAGEGRNQHQRDLRRRREWDDPEDDLHPLR